MRSLKCEVSSLKLEEAAGRMECRDSALTSHSKLRTSNFRPGFNLVETLAATMILSGAVLTLGAISTNALTNTRLHRHYEQAASVIDQQLSLIDFVGIDQFIEAGQMDGVTEGDVGVVAGEPGQEGGVDQQQRNRGSQQEPHREVRAVRDRVWAPPSPEHDEIPEVSQGHLLWEQTRLRPECLAS